MRRVAQYFRQYRWSPVKTLDISEAAQFLKMNPEVLRRKAKLNL
jgi:hypothetical protein